MLPFASDRFRRLALLLLMGMLSLACQSATGEGGETLRLATTTSTADSGLLNEILPQFEAESGATVRVLAVGTGQALALGEQGDVDVLLVHAKELEEEFIAEGYGIARHEVMFNDFIIVGPTEDPAGIQSVDLASSAFQRIAASGALFVSRGDSSGTHQREQALWQQAALQPDTEAPWYRSIGQGMGETLITADELDAYTLTDRGTYLAMQGKLPGLRPLFGGRHIDENPDPALLNVYSVIAINPERHSRTNSELARRFIEWLTRADTQQRIGEFGKERFGLPLFHPMLDDATP